jgi:ABC-2 type transport system permease protein
MLSASFWRRNRAFFRLAVISNLEYRLNFFTDSIIQPCITGLVELTLWIALFKATAQTQINGFSLEAYLSYALWAAFTSRITSTWMYEYRMINEIDSGSINSLLVRPLSFFEYYLSQFLGYKFITSVFSLLVPLGICWWMGFPIYLNRLPEVLALITYYLVLVQLLSFIVATTAFHLNRVTSFTVTKNLALWLLSGELVPIDLFPENIQKILLSLPFANAVYVPVGYLTGRVSESTMRNGWLNTTLGILVLSAIAAVAWRQGLRKYAGTGA